VPAPGKQKPFKGDMRSISLNSMLRLVVICFSALVLASPARSTSYSTDNSDVWAAHGEDGWGLQLVQRANVMFATMYVYDINDLPTFFTATLYDSGTNATGADVWIGDLYVTRGPFYGLSYFDPSQVSYRKVGQMTYATQDIDSASLSYTVDGATVNKAIYRFTLRNDDYTGSYIGAYKLTTSRCFNPADNGISVLLGTFSVTSQSSNALTMVTNAYEGLTCNYPGDYQQFGQFGQSRGSFTCTNGESGSYTLSEMNVTHTDMRGRIDGSDNRGCVLSGSFSALRQ
jgi:hypothetical protein